MKRKNGFGNKEMKKYSKKEILSTIKRLLVSVRPYYGWIAFSSLLAIGGVVISIIAPHWLSDFTDEITRGAAKQNIDLEKLKGLGITLGSFYVANALLSFTAGFIMTTISQRYAMRLRKDILAKVNRVPLSYFDSHPYGDTLSILTNDVDSIGESLQQSIEMVISAFLMLIGVLIAMFITSWPLALTAMLSLPLMGILLVVFTQIAVPLFKKRQDILAKVNGIVEENYSGQVIIKAFNAEDRVNANFNKANTELMNVSYKAMFFGSMMSPLMNFMSYFAYAAVCVVGGLLMNEGGGVTFGTITAFLVYINLFQSPLSQLAQASNTLQMAAASGMRVFNFLDEKELSDETGKERKLIGEDGKEHVKGEVEFSHVCFSYVEGKEVIHDFSALVKPGMKVAIVGPTGAGKTTIVNLLMRFYEVNSGDIKIDGVSIKDMPRSEIRDIFGMVLQDTWMFEGTLRENLVYSTKGLTDKDIMEACEEAGISHYVSTLPGELNCYFNDGTTISGGQRQLITIARAMLERAPLLILDEATSNVDTRTEEAIQEAMDKLTEGRTSFVIAHRLSTIKNADLILVMKNGNIIEQGNHAQLMAQNGFYASLYNSQFASD